MDWEHPGRLVNREMAFRLAMVAFRNASVSREWGSEEAVWAVEHLSTEMMRMMEGEAQRDILMFLQRVRYNRVEYVKDLEELKRLCRMYMDYKNMMKDKRDTSLMERMER